MAVIKTERLVLRPWDEGDIPALKNLADNRNIWLQLRNLFPHPYTEAHARDWVQRAQENEQEHPFALEWEGQLVGAVSLTLLPDVYHKAAELGYWIGEPFWRRGFATEAVKGVIFWAFSRFDLQRIEAGVFEGNSASRRVLEKAGFKLEAKLKKRIFKDEKILEEWMFAALR